MIRTIIWCFFSPLVISYIQEQGIHIIFFSTFLTNSWSHLYSDSTTGQKSGWNDGPYPQVICIIIRSWYLQQQTHVREGRTTDIWSETLPSQLYLLLLIVDRCEAMAPMVSTYKRRSKAVFGEKKWGGGQWQKVYVDLRLLGVYNSDADLRGLFFFKKFHICILLLEQSLQWKVHCSPPERELKTITCCLLTGRIYSASQDVAFFFKWRQGDLCKHATVPPHPHTHSWKISF